MTFSDLHLPTRSHNDDILAMRYVGLLTPEIQRVQAHETVLYYPMARQCAGSAGAQQRWQVDRRRANSRNLRGQVRQQSTESGLHAYRKIAHYGNPPAWEISSHAGLVSDVLVCAGGLHAHRRTRRRLQVDCTPGHQPQWPRTLLDPSILWNRLQRAARGRNFNVLSTYMHQFERLTAFSPGFA